MADIVSIIIPAYCLVERTIVCLERLREATPGRYFHVTVVDDGSPDSTDDTIQTIGAKLFSKKFKFIRMERNLGFAQACNIGAATSSSEFLLFLNNDTEVLENWLPPLLSAFRETPRLGSCSPLLFFPESGRLQHAGVVFDLDLRASHLYFLFPGDHPVLQRRRRLQAISASAFMIPRQLFEALGGFYPGYINGSEDLDICAAIRAQGLELTCVPKSRILHYTSQTPGRFAHVETNSRLLNARQTGRFAPDLADIARRDGYETRLNPWLVPYLSVPPAREKSLACDFDQGDLSAVEVAMEAEPLWEASYVRAVRENEASGAFQAALTAGRLRSHFFPSLESFAEAVRLARLAGETVSEQEALTNLLAAKHALGRPDILIAKARTQERHFRELGQLDFAGLYANWLRARGHALNAAL